MSQTNYQTILSDLVAPLWQNYCLRAPQAKKIIYLLEEHNKRVKHDHISFKTLNFSFVSGSALAEKLAQYGYCIRDRVSCHEQHLELYWLRHPTPDVPAILISELDYRSLSVQSQSILEQVVDTNNQCPWGLNTVPKNHPSLQQFELLNEESEMAAWFSLFGTCAHYFSINVNQLDRQNDMPKLIKLLMEEGFPLDSRSGLIGRSSGQMIEQIMTLPDQQEINFPNNEKARVSTGCLHFTLRFKSPSGKLYKDFFLGVA